MNYSRLFHAIVVVGCAWTATACGGSPAPGPDVTKGKLDGGTGDMVGVVQPDHDMHDAIDGGWHPTK